MLLHHTVVAQAMRPIMTSCRILDVQSETESFESHASAKIGWPRILNEFIQKYESEDKPLDSLHVDIIIHHH